MYLSVPYLLLCALGVILATFIGLLLYFTLYIHYIHRINAHLPGPPRSSFFLGHISDVRRYKKDTGRTMVDYLVEMRLKYGSIFAITLLHRCLVYLSDQSYLRDVFVLNHKNAVKSPAVYNKLGFIFGERGIGYGLVTNTENVLWRQRRNVMNPAFHRKCLNGFMVNFNNVSDRFLTRLGMFADNNKEVRMLDELGKVTLEAISQVSFNIDTKAIEDPDSPFPSAIRNYLAGVQANFDSALPAHLLGIFQLGLFQSKLQKVQIDAARFLRKFANDCIEARMKDIADEKNVPNDLLTLLIKSGGISRDGMIDEYLTIFIAGQETTASSLSFALFEILSNPDVEDKLLKEIEEVLGTRTVVEFADLPRLKYMGQVLQENLRKHLIAKAPSRILTKDMQVGGYKLHAGTFVLSNSLLFGMNPEIWKDPEVFDPERFADPASIPNISMIHFPFSFGQRSCIGQTFAKFESKVILVKLFQKFTFELLPGQTDRYEEHLTMSPRDGVMCKLRRRHRVLETEST